MVSWIWIHCVKVDKSSARCRKCNKVLALSGGNKGVVSHLTNVHGFKDPKKQIENSNQQSSSSLSPVAKKQKTVSDYFQFTSLEETLARLAAESGLTIRQICKTTYIRKTLQKDFPKQNIPKNQSGIMKLIMKFYKEAKENTILKISWLKQQGKKFSSTLDEWTSLKSSRYLNVNIHYEDEGIAAAINLGLVLVTDSCPAEKIKKLVCCVKC
jgi:BED zinc finger